MNNMQMPAAPMPGGAPMPGADPMAAMLGGGMGGMGGDVCPCCGQPMPPGMSPVMPDNGMGPNMPVPGGAGGQGQIDPMLLQMLMSGGMPPAGPPAGGGAGY